MVVSGGGAGTFLLPSLGAAAEAPPVAIAAAMPSSAAGQQQTYPGGSLGGLFNRPGLIGGFAAGFLGAGLFGLLFGHGMVGELSGVAAALGLLFQIALLVMLTRLIWTWWRAGNAPAFADRSPRQLADAYDRPRHEVRPDIDTGAGAVESKNDAFNR
jgi:predicted lipid-binding transport protein (Tim44 family)